MVMQEYFAKAAHNLTVWRRSAFFQSARKHAFDLKNIESREISNLFDLTPAITTCPPGSRLEIMGVDKDDGGKWMCGLKSMQAPCHVISLGSNGNFNFENDILANTPCDVHTFDCTMATRGGGTKLHATRHNFFLKCIGSQQKADSDSNFVTLPQAMKLAGAKKVDVLKIDIEGFEYDVMATWGTLEESDLDTQYLPLQILIEVHLQYMYFGTSYFGKNDLSNLMWPMAEQMSPPELMLFFSHLGELGYAVVNMEKNPGCAHCAEYVLLRVR